MRRAAGWILCAVGLAVLSLGPAPGQVPHGASEAHQDDSGDHHGSRDKSEGGHHYHDEEGVMLTPEQRAAAGIISAPLTVRDLGAVVTAPGEIQRNGYRTSQVTPRITAQVVARHATLGHRVRKGQPLVTLSSVAMAQAQGELLVAEREWARVRGLGAKVVSDRRYVEARVANQQARARLLAYGMSSEELQALLKASDARLATGEFDLLAPRDGTVIRDEFVEGELIEPGRVLFEISDESSLWVEARLPPEEALRIAEGDAARVRVAGRWHDGRVVAAHHSLDPTTRTLGVRVEVANPDDTLHAGQFVEVRIVTGKGVPGLAVPDSALVRGADGDWVVFVERGRDHFAPVEVQVSRKVGELSVISGVPEGTPVVTSGAFFLNSELSKGGFEVHQH